MQRIDARQECSTVDVREFVEVSRTDVDPIKLANDFERDFEQTVSDHRMTREQLETPVSV